MQTSEDKKVCSKYKKRHRNGGVLPMSTQHQPNTNPTPTKQFYFEQIENMLSTDQTLQVVINNRLACLQRSIDKLSILKMPLSEYMLGQFAKL